VYCLTPCLGAGVSSGVFIKLPCIIICKGLTSGVMACIGSGAWIDMEIGQAAIVVMSFNSWCGWAMCICTLPCVLGIGRAMVVAFKCGGSWCQKNQLESK